mmetsp:Transcript_9208/g.16355  ORF Transcript_9208/g.16355 Transcript_9208/m.16355 type:complete len:105 (-) Transcript_9208:59-373(-)
MVAASCLVTAMKLSSAVYFFVGDVGSAGMVIGCSRHVRVHRMFLAAICVSLGGGCYCKRFSGARRKILHLKIKTPNDCSIHGPTPALLWWAWEKNTDESSWLVG